MKIIHSADWHLGHELHGFNRYVEQEAFLQWLTKTLVEQQIDVLIVAGDIFDTVNPSAAALKQLFGFIRESRRQIPHLQTILIGGNHDSASRMEAPNPLFEQFGVHSIGRLPRHGDDVNWQKLLIPLFDKHGKERAILAAIPYLRQADLPPPSTFDGDPLIEGVRWIYKEAVTTAQKQLKTDCGLILTGHCYMHGGEISKLSERRIFGGGEHALPADIFPKNIDYVALGHLHKGQRVGGREEIRYSGSPLPLSVTERNYHHGVRAITMDESGRVKKQESIAVPRTVPYLRIPKQGSLPLPDALDALKNLALEPIDPGLDLRPFLEVVIKLDGPEPGLRSHIDQALEGKAVRLAGIQAITEGAAGSLADNTQASSLDEIKPEKVFRLIHQKKYNREPDPALNKAFAEILEDLLNPTGHGS